MEELNQPKVPAPLPLPRMLSLEQVQEILNLGMPSIYALVKSGELRAAQFGGRNAWRVRQAPHPFPTFFAQSARRVK